ncbi:MAG TPA: transglutaminaseTgpA domain-containing protein [Frankiaceae bacterium]|nr:transglutaminaseTgpA domain-containing protein [Frankiaceae bacterium]
MTQATPLPTSTRIAGLATAAAAIACLGAADGLHPALVPVSVVAMALAELLTMRRSPRTNASLRAVVLPVALVLCTGPAMLALLRANGDPELVRTAGARLAAGALVVFPLAGSARRDLLTRLALAAVTAGLAASIGGATVLLPGLLFLASALVLLAVLERDRLTPLRIASRASAPTVRSVRSVPRPAASVPRPALAAGVALLATGLLAVTLAGAVTLPTPHAGRNGGSGVNGEAGTPASGGDRLSSSTGHLDLRQRGDLPHEPVAQVATADPLLWRSSVLTGYDGNTWRALGSSGTETAPGPQAADRTDAVTLLGPGDRVLLSPGVVTGLEPAGGRGLGYGNARRTASDSYTVTSAVPTVGPDDRTPVAEPTSDQRALELPELPARVVDLARGLTAGASTRTEAVDAIVRHLRETYRYRLDSAVPDRGTDAVDDFLFRTREGFCEQFASAAAVLLRAVGVPTRLAVGYADGNPSNGGRLLRGSDAHAWIEVEYPDAGWVAVDPTAGVRRADGDASGWRAWLSTHGTGTALLALVGLAGGVALGVGQAAAQRRRQERGLDPLDRALSRLDRRLGVARRRPDETLREFADRLPLTADERSAVLVAEASRYAPAAPDQRTRRTAADVLIRFPGRRNGSGRRRPTARR